MEQQLKDQLQSYRAELITQLAAIDCIIGKTFPAAENGQPQKPRITPKTPAVAPVLRPRARRRASVQQEPQKTAKPDGEPTTLVDAIRESIRHLTAPWSRVELVDYMERRFPEILSGAGASSMSSTLCNLKKRGEIEDVGTRPGLTCPLPTYKVVAKPEA